MRRRHQEGWRVGPAVDQRPADRERILFDDPAEARDPHRRASGAGAVQPRRAVHRGALPGRRPVRTGRHRARDRPLPRRLPAVLRARGKPADQRDGGPGPRPQLRPHREGRPPSRPDPHARRRRSAAEGLGDELLERIRPLAACWTTSTISQGRARRRAGAQKAKVAGSVERRRPRACSRKCARSVPSPPSACARANCTRLLPRRTADAGREAVFDEMAQAVAGRAGADRATDTGSFDDFVAAYNSSTLCVIADTRATSFAMHVGRRGPNLLTFYNEHHPRSAAAEPRPPC
jgi:hypothetical protein